MKVVRNNIRALAVGHQQEQAGKLDEAAATYQKLVDADPGNREAVNRLIIVYRRLKDPRRELDVIDAALKEVEGRDKAANSKWMSEHPGAAKLGRDMLKSLGGQSASAYGNDPLVAKLSKRKALLEKKIGNKRSKSKPSPVRKVEKGTAGTGKPANAAKASDKRNKESLKKNARAEKARTREAERREKDRIKQNLRQQQEQALANKVTQQQKEQARAQKVAQQEKAKAEKEAKAQARKEATTLKKQKRAEEREARMRPSLFIVSLRYLVSLEKIDAAMARHMDFLKKHFATGTFLVSGRQVPRTGGIILMKALNKTAAAQIMKQDPFVKERLASFDIVEFKASQMAEGLGPLIQLRKNLT